MVTIKELGMVRKLVGIPGPASQGHNVGKERGGRKHTQRCISILRGMGPEDLQNPESTHYVREWKGFKKGFVPVQI